MHIAIQNRDVGRSHVKNLFQWWVFSNFFGVFLVIARNLAWLERIGMWNEIAATDFQSGQILVGQVLNKSSVPCWWSQTLKASGAGCHTCLGEILGSCVENVSIGRIGKLGEISYNQCPPVEYRDYHRMKEAAVLHTGNGSCHVHLLQCSALSPPPQALRFLLQHSIFLLLPMPTLLHSCPTENFTSWLHICIWRAQLKLELFCVTLWRSAPVSLFLLFCVQWFYKSQQHSFY